jgi:hypothetical protein
MRLPSGTSDTIRALVPGCETAEVEDTLSSNNSQQTGLNQVNEYENPSHQPSGHLHLSGWNTSDQAGECGFERGFCIGFTSL